MAYSRIPEPGEPIQLRDFFLEDRRFPAVYFLYHRGEVVYVGQTRTLRFRIDQHIADGVKTFDAIGFVRCPLDKLAKYESHYIRLLAPKYNACGLSKKLRQRKSWTRDRNREQAARTDAHDVHVEDSATCGVKGDDGRVYIRPKDIGKFLQITDKDAAELFGHITENIYFFDLMLMTVGDRDVQRAQQRFEDLI